MMVRRIPASIALAATLAVAACELPAPPPPGDGVDLPEGACGHALYVVATDGRYQSTSVSIATWTGETASAGILTSGSEEPGLSAALSGDVVAPTTRTSSGEVVLIDRYPAAVLTFFDPVAPAVRAQLSVQTGFYSNPQDYLELDDGRAYVTRYGRNLDPGKEPFDTGSDVLIIDRKSPSIVGRIDLDAVIEGEDPALLPAPNRMVKNASTVFALVTSYSRDFKKSGDARLIAIDPSTDAIVSTLPLANLRGCLGLAIAPSGTRLAVLCSGTFTGPSTPTNENAGIAIATVSGTTLALESRLDAPPRPLGQAAAFASEDVLLATTLGELDDQGEPAVADQLLEIDLGTNATRELLSSAGAPFSFGDVRCEPACGACFLADASRAVIQRMAVASGHATAPKAYAVDDGLGSLPRWLGAY
ncbi:MAG TPA: hypothetical protein VL400_11365 [Polyangiaceae bacterium]|nr:hypothetical protein [Polyangiaceae bacterium]